MRLAKNYYTILGVGCDATPDEIKAAYRRKALELHPDHSGTDGKPFLGIQEAYEVLSNLTRRRAYDDRQAAGQSRRGAAGTGEVTEELPLSISFQPGITGDCTVRITGEQVGMCGVDLALHVRVR
jgi:molecular chaperone DnaJ